LNTLLAIGCSGAKGDKDIQTAIDDIWTKQFVPRKLDIKGIKPGQLAAAGKPIVYYKTWGQIAPQDPAALLKSCNGDCIAFSKLMIGVMDAHNYKGFQTATATPTTKGELFMIKNWKILKDPGSSTLKNYQYLNISQNANIAQNTANGWAYVWQQEEVHDDAGIPGQNNPNPDSIFIDHEFTVLKLNDNNNKKNGTYYDPSYGLTYTSAADFEMQAMANYAVYGNANSGPRNLDIRKVGGNVGLSLTP
jgi:hypothetical protein